MENDFISRQAAIRIVCDDECEDCPDGGCDMYRRLKRLPAADVRPVVRARWEDETGYIFINLAQRVYCPVCKSYAYFYPITAKNFCPNCGADMREAHHGSP